MSPLPVIVLASSFCRIYFIFLLESNLTCTKLVVILWEKHWIQSAEQSSLVPEWMLVERCSFIYICLLASYPDVIMLPFPNLKNFLNIWLVPDPWLPLYVLRLCLYPDGGYTFQVPLWYDPKQILNTIARLSAEILFCYLSPWLWIETQI